MDFKSLATSVAAMALKVLPGIVPGAGAAIALGRKVLDLGQELQGHLPPGHEQRDLALVLDELEKTIMAHADRTIDSLGDGPT